MAVLLGLKSTFTDARMRYLGGWLLYGFVFFSASQNKLAGYLLPLMPGLALLLAVGIDQAIEESEIVPWLLAASAALLMILPAIAHALPEAMNAGFGKTPVHLALATPFVLVAGLVWWLSWSAKPSLAILTLGIAVMFGAAYFKGSTFPVLDDRVSARGFWRAHQNEIGAACLEGVGRSWEYGLNYYAGRALAECSGQEQTRITLTNGRLLIKK